MPIGAVIGASVIGAGASIHTANKAGREAHKAMNASMEQQERVATAAQPFLDRGNAAYALLADPNALMAGFQKSPDYDFRMQEGMNAVTQNRAVNGLLRSGSALRGVTRYASNLASGEWNNYIQRQQFLAGQAGMGLSAIAGVANNNSQAIQKEGDAQANKYIAQGNAFAQGAGGIAGAIMDWDAKRTGGVSSYGY